MLKEKFQKNKILFMKEKNVLLRDLVGIILTSITNEEKKDGKEITEDKIIKLLKTEQKVIFETIDLYKKVGKDFVDETTKLEYISSFIPESLNEEQTKQIIEKIIVNLGIEDKFKEIGRIIGEAKKVQGIDLGLVNKVLRG